MKPTPRTLTAAEVTFTLECLPEDVEIEGNAMASGDAAADREQEEWVRSQLASGNDWAWCTVKVTAHWGDFKASDYLGCCSYLSEEDFVKGGYYYDDMKAETLAALNHRIAKAVENLSPLL